MNIPDFNKFMYPLLAYAKQEGKSFHLKEATSFVQQALHLPDEALSIMLASGADPIFKDRLGWAKAYLCKAGALETPKRGFVQINARGLDLLEQHGMDLNQKHLLIFPEFQAFKSRTKSPTEKPQAIDLPVAINETTPDEQIDLTIQLIHRNLADDLLVEIKRQSPTFFEHLVLKLLVKMGYGDEYETTQVSRDGGIDGMVRQDVLGLDMIYVQAKRWDEGSVGSKDIQAFVGAMAGRGATKGVFITTSTFTKNALEYAKTLQNQKVVLVDGQALARYMIEYDLGVSAYRNIALKKLDSDFFD